MKRSAGSGSTESGMTTKAACDGQLISTTDAGWRGGYRGESIEEGGASEGVGGNGPDGVDPSPRPRYPAASSSAHRATQGDHLLPRFHIGAALASKPLHHHEHRKDVGMTFEWFVVSLIDAVGWLADRPG